MPNFINDTPTPAQTINHKQKPVAKPPWAKRPDWKKIKRDADYFTKVILLVSEYPPASSR